MPLLHGYQQRLPGQDDAGPGTGQDRGDDGDGTTNDGFQDALVPHEVIVDIEPVMSLCARGEFATSQSSSGFGFRPGE